MTRATAGSGSLIWWVIAAALLLRVIGIGFGLPAAYHQDEPIVVNHALAYAGGDFNPHFFKIPPLVSYLLFGVYGFTYVLLCFFTGATTEQFGALYFRDPTLFFMLGRCIFGAFFGTLSVAVLFRLGKKLLGERAAILAASLFAFSYLHVRDCHYLYADIPMLFSILMVFDSLADYAKQGRSKALTVSAFWSGVAIAFKYIAAPILAPVFIAAWQVNRRQKKSVISAWMGAGSLAVLTYVALNPFSVLDFSFFLGEIRQQAAAEASMSFFHHLFYSLSEGMGFFGMAAGVAGIFWLWGRRAKTRWFWSFPLVYYLLIVFFSQPYERYAMPLLPFLCLSAAAFTEEIKWRGRRFFYLVLVAALLLPSLCKDVYLARLLLRPDTRDLAAVWISKNIPAGSGVVLDHAFFSPRLTQTKNQLLDKLTRVSADDPYKDAKMEKIRLLSDSQNGQKAYRVYYLNEERLKGTPFLMWSPLIDPDWGVFEREGIQYYVRYRYPGEGNFFEETSQGKADLLRVFSPYRNSKKVFTEDPWANVALPFKGIELFSRDRPGPYLEIYRIKRV